MPTRNLPLLSWFAATLPWAVRHFWLSLGVAILTALLVFGAWYPAPFREISGGLSLFVLMLGVDVVCGPVITLVLLHPSKSRQALAVDMVLIAGLQLGALAFGLHSLSHARPLALVFEVDRFRVVSYADIQEVDLANAPDWVSPWRFEAPRVLGTRTARSGAEKLDSVDASLQGVEPGQRPDWWQDYAFSATQAKERSLPLEALQQLNPDRIDRIQTAAAQAALEPQANETSSPNALRWLPVVSRQTMDWVVFVDPVTGRVRGYVHASGFAP